MPFTFKNTDIEGLVIIEPRIFHDDRGFFMESYKSSDFTSNGISEIFVQDNHSLSKKDVLRGLHYQKNPGAQGKLVRVVSGRAWDVAVDIRKNSRTFLRWFALELNDENNLMLYVPPGFAHGFLALSEQVHLMYKCTHEYDGALDTGIRWDDPDINISWPVSSPFVSEKDAALPLFKDAELF